MKVILSAFSQRWTDGQVKGERGEMADNLISKDLLLDYRGGLRLLEVFVLEKLMKKLQRCVNDIDFNNKEKSRNSPVNMPSELRC